MDHVGYLHDGDADTRRRRSDRTEAISDLFLSQHRRLVGLATLLVGDRQTAEDIVQDAFASLYRRWHDLRDPHSAISYLNRTVVNAGRDELRHGRRVVAGLRQMTPRSDELASAEHAAVEHDEADRLWEGICELPHRQRQVLVLRYYLDQSEAEIAEILEISAGSVKKHASRALAALARSLEAAP